MSTLIGRGCQNTQDFKLAKTGLLNFVSIGQNLYLHIISTEFEFVNYILAKVFRKEVGSKSSFRCVADTPF